ncbi:MAG: peptidoglycan DD-metalloendopeptidase family protein [Gammaproteobacteria bacterium]
MFAAKPARVCLIATLLTLHGCGGSPLAPVSDRTVRTAGPPAYHPAYHIVTKGDTLYSISWAYGYDYREVARWNGIARPYRIYPGEKIRLRPPAAPRRSVVTRHAPPVRHQTSRRTKAHEQPRPRPVRHIAAWTWPAKGPLLQSFSAGDPRKKGIDIGGKRGQPIRATAAGEVVYSGSGLIRYGKLIIIKHNHDYFSAYAHNERLLVKEGDRVHAGQEIARMGSTGTTRTMLHFEIRRDGKPVNPLRYLPKR